MADEQLGTCIVAGVGTALGACTVALGSYAIASLGNMAGMPEVASTFNNVAVGAFSVAPLIIGSGAGLAGLTALKDMVKPGPDSILSRAWEGLKSVSFTSMGVGVAAVGAAGVGLAFSRATGGADILPAVQSVVEYGGMMVGAGGVTLAAMAVPEMLICGAR